MTESAIIGAGLEAAANSLGLLAKITRAGSAGEARASLDAYLKAVLGEEHAKLASDPAAARVIDGAQALAEAREAELAEQSARKRKLAHLETYMTVSSVVAQPVGLHELMENTLYCCMDVFGAQAASVLLLDETKQNFEFYQAEGEAKEQLASFRIPVTHGIAGDVHRTGKSEIINDAQSDPRLFRSVDSETAFVTRQMLVTPLVAGGEKIGVFEVINKIEGDGFTEEERGLLALLAEEIAFAIRNARIFEVVVDSYCKQRQGLNTCKGCKRPLGAWTPCIKNAEM